jgi:FkbM family methyltransferase
MRWPEKWLSDCGLHRIESPAPEPTAKPIAAGIAAPKPTPSHVPVPKQSPAVIVPEVSHYERQEFARLLRFRNRHRGQACLLLCNGPSLHQVEFSRIDRNRFKVIGLNKIYLGLELVGTAPDYVVAVDKKVIEQSAEAYARLPAVKFLSNRAGTDLLVPNPALFYKNITQLPRPCNRFSTGITQYVQEGWTVTHAALPVAYYMGFKSVFIVGMDHWFSQHVPGQENKASVIHGDDVDHFHPGYFGHGLAWRPASPREQRDLLQGRPASLRTGRATDRRLHHRQGLPRIRARQHRFDLRYLGQGDRLERRRANCLGASCRRPTPRRSPALGAESTQIFDRPWRNFMFGLINGDRVHDTLQRLHVRDKTVYAMLAHLCPRVCVDVGASNGQTTELMLRHAPNTHITAFEPWPANVEQFRARIRSDQVTLHTAACGSSPGQAKFFCGSTTQTGYSSVGYVVKPGMQRDPQKQIDVEILTLDETVAQHIDFLKIDVQGGEREVLTGASAIVRQHGIDMILVEYNNDPELLAQLRDWDYVLFDLEYLLYLENDDFRTNWLEQYTETRLTTGATAWQGHLKPGAPRDLHGWSEFVAAQRGVQTDLLAVQKRFLHQASVAFSAVTGEFFS